MSHRPINRKKANKIRKELRRTPRAYLDIVEYLKIRKLAQTTGEAEKLILASRVHHDGAAIGLGVIPFINERGKPDTKMVVQRRVDAAFRGAIEVVADNYGDLVSGR